MNAVTDGRAAGWHRDGVRDARGGAGDLLPLAALTHPAASLTHAASGVGSWASGRPCSTCCTSRASSTRRPSRSMRLLLDERAVTSPGAHDVPDSRGQSGGARARKARPAPPPEPSAPRAVATRPNELWSWDITKLLGPQKWTVLFYLYVIPDVFSRYVVGWMIAHEESAALARKLIEETCRRQGVEPRPAHAARRPWGSSTTSKSVALLLADLGVTKTHPRPHVSNDNSFSESAFKIASSTGLASLTCFMHTGVHAHAHGGPFSRLVQQLTITTAPSASARRTTCTTASRLRPCSAVPPSRRRVPRSPGALLREAAPSPLIFLTPRRSLDLPCSAPEVATDLAAQQSSPRTASQTR